MNKPIYHFTGTLLISTALVLFAAFTTVFTQQAVADAPDKPISVTTNRVFMPLVQSDPEIALKEADDRLGDLATVASVVVSTTTSFPRQINALVRGSLPTACMEIAKIQQRQAADQIWLTIATRFRLDRRFVCGCAYAFCRKRCARSHRAGGWSIHRCGARGASQFHPNRRQSRPAPSLSAPWQPRIGTRSDCQGRLYF